MHAQKSVAIVFMFARTTKCFKNTKNFAINSKLVKFCYLSQTATVSLSKKFHAKKALPMVVYFDLETIIVPVSSVEQNPQTSRTRGLDKQIPSGYCYVAISLGSPNFELFHLYRGEDCMQVFVEQMETLAKDIYEKKQTNRYFTGAVGQAKELATHCWI